MGFHISHMNKYWRWVKKTQADYRDCRKVSRELAGINRRLAFAMLRGQTEKTERISDEKHVWILDYVSARCPETLEKYRSIPTPSDITALNPERKASAIYHTR